MPGRMPTQEEVLGYCDSLSNWGRWGPDDELGTLNFITPQKRLQAAASVRDGISIGCARVIPKYPSGPNVGLRALHLMTASGDADGAAASADFLRVEYHVLSVTHVDALAHIFWNGRMYNNRPSNLVTTIDGATVW